jgi:CubicO group peptidase (beta-lactamase class C family)
MVFDELIGDNFQGCISIKRNGKHLFRQAYGYANLTDKVPNTLETKFATASAGKIFVAVAILQLIENGRLHFNDTIGQILDFNLHAIDPDITIEQLLTHTSGIPDYFDESIMDDYDALWKDYPNYKIRTSSDLLPLFINKPMMYPKGERFQYNNTGYAVLGLIIEKITCMPFDLFLKENIFSVCGMDSTGYYELDRLPAKCANSYIFDRERNEYYTNIYSVDVKGTGAGGAFTTAGDIERFWNALLQHRLLSADMSGKMLSRQSGSSRDGYYGYGIWLKKDENNCFEPYFQGCDPGVGFISAYRPKDDLLITVISNFGNNVRQIVRRIIQALDAEQAR